MFRTVIADAVVDMEVMHKTKISGKYPKIVSIEW